MDKREALQAVKEAKRHYLLWTGRVEAVMEGMSVGGEGALAGSFERWYGKMARILHHFEEYQAMKEPHEQAEALFMKMQEMIAEGSGKGWASRLFSRGGREEQESLAQTLLGGFQGYAAQVIEHLNLLERRLLVMRNAEWEARQNGTWGQPAPAEITPDSWAVITKY